MKPFQPLNRRTFLCGAGASLALPLLDGMQPALGAAVETAARAGVTQSGHPVRLAWVFFPNGTNMHEWKPTGEGLGWEPSSTLKPLTKVKDELTVFSGLAHANAESRGDGPGDHARSAAAFLTGVHPTKTAGAGIRAGISADQFVAEQIGFETKLPSLELGTEMGRGSGSCDSGYSCAYSNNISWRSETQPSAKEINPRLAFERLFGGQGGDQGAQAQRIAQQQSILDVVAAQTRSLQKRLGGDDRRKLDEYFNSVREVERRIDHQSKLEAAEQKDQLADAKAKAFEAPIDHPTHLTEHIRLMYDLMVLAMRTDSTRVLSFMLANEGSNRRFPMIDVNNGHHELSHHQNNARKMEQIAKIDRYLVEQYAYFVEKLRATPEGEGTLLDYSLVLYGGAISDGNRHNHNDLPIVVAGRGGGAFTPGRHVRATSDTPLCNLFLSMFAAAGVESERFGDSTGRLPQVNT